MFRINLTNKISCSSSTSTAFSLMISRRNNNISSIISNNNKNLFRVHSSSAIADTTAAANNMTTSMLFSQTRFSSSSQQDSSNTNKEFVTGTKVKTPTSCYEWRELASSLTPHQTASVDGVHYNQVECIIRGLQFDPKDHEAWYELGVAIMNGAKTGTHTAVGSFQQSVTLKPEDNAGAWIALGSVMGEFDVILNNNMPINKQQCFEKAIEDEIRKAGGSADIGTHSKTSALAWMLLGDYLDSRPPKKVKPLPGTVELPDMATIDGDSYTALDCYQKVVEIDQTRFPAWNGCGVALVSRYGRYCEDRFITINGKKYTARECFIRALELDHSWGFVWENLLQTIRPNSLDGTEEHIVVGGTSFTRAQISKLAVQYSSGRNVS